MVVGVMLTDLDVAGLSISTWQESAMEVRDIGLDELITQQHVDSANSHRAQLSPFYLVTNFLSLLTHNSAGFLAYA